MEPDGLLSNRYRLDRKVAQGGMGAVWEAYDLQLDRKVALKLISDAVSRDADARVRFFHEAKAAAGIQSPNVVQIIDFGIDAGTLFIVMEWLEGEDLGRKLKRQGAMPAAEVAGLLKQLARGLKKAHDRHVVHRDLKPANVFIAEADGEAIAKILDFGIAKAEAIAQNAPNEGDLVLGSIPFISPEQARAQANLDYRSDLWSVAVLVYLCLSGKLPFGGGNLQADTEVLVRVITGPATPLSSSAPSLGRAYDEFFHRAFQKDPAARFQSIDELSNAFLHAAGNPVPTLTLPSRTGGLLASAGFVESLSSVAFGPAPTLAQRVVRAAHRDRSRVLALAALATASLVIVIAMVLFTRAKLSRPPSGDAAAAASIPETPPSPPARPSSHAETTATGEAVTNASTPNAVESARSSESEPLAADTAPSADSSPSSVTGVSASRPAVGPSPVGPAPTQPVKGGPLLKRPTTLALPKNPY